MLLQQCLRFLQIGSPVERPCATPLLIIGLSQFQKFLALFRQTAGIYRHIDIVACHAAPGSLQTRWQMGRVIHKFHADIAVPVNIQQTNRCVVSMAEGQNLRHGFPKSCAQRGLDAAGMGYRQRHAFLTNFLGDPPQAKQQAVRHLLERAGSWGSHIPRTVAPIPVILRILLSDVAPSTVLPHTCGHLTQQDTHLYWQIPFLGDRCNCHNGTEGIAGIDCIDMDSFEPAA